MNPLRAHFQTMMALEQNQKSDADLSAAQKLLTKMKHYQMQLKVVSSISDKVKFKANWLPEFQPWLDGVMQSATPDTADPIFSTMVLWKIDTGQLNDAVEMTLFAIAKQFETIAGFDRSLPNLLVEEIHDQLKKGQTLDLAKADTLAQLVEAKKADGFHRVDLLDEIRAKYLRQVGELHEGAGNKERAIELYQKALEYNPKVGAKQLLDKLLKS